MNCGMNVTKNPKQMVIADSRLQKSEYIFPVIFGHQKCSPACQPSIIPPTIVKWKWATTKYVSCRWMSDPMTPRYRPVIPPMVNNAMNPSENNIGASNVIDPLYRVAVQLNTLMALGTATSMVMNE